MAFINFVIPGKLSDLLGTGISGEYVVNNVTGVKTLQSELNGRYWGKFVGIPDFDFFFGIIAVSPR